MNQPIFIICALVSFLIKKPNGEKLMVWKSVQKKIVWELIYIFAGGLAVGTLITNSGAAVAIPIVLNLAIAMGLDPIPYMLAASVGVNLSYCMPTSIRAVPVGYGLPPNYMFKHGIKLAVIVVALMTAMVWVLMEYWPTFSVVW